MISTKSSRNLILLLLPVVVWLFFNTTANRHIHVLSDGFVISHSHPFVKNQADSKDSNPHQHTRKELMLLSLFSGLVFSILSLLVLKPKLHNHPQLLRIRVTHQEPEKKYFQVHHYHAPPVSC